MEILHSSDDKNVHGKKSHAIGIFKQGSEYGMYFTEMI
jgi:hypothetical protein